MRIPWNAIQTAVYGVLVADGDVGALVGDRIYDYLPAPPLTFPFITLGEFESETLEDKAGMQAPSLTIEARSIQKGKKEVNDILDAVCKALGGVRLSLSGFTVYSAGLVSSSGGDVEQWEDETVVNVGFVRIRWFIK